MQRKSVFVGVDRTKTTGVLVKGKSGSKRVGGANTTVAKKVGAKKVATKKVGGAKRAPAKKK